MSATAVDFQSLQEMVTELSVRERAALVALLRDRGESGSNDSYYLMLAEVYEELPVSMGDFLYAPEYLDLKGIIYPKVADILVECDDPTIREIALEFGKGSGKSFISGVFMLRQVYRLLCFRSPQRYLGLDLTSAPAIVNMSVQGNQAERIIFREFRERVRSCPWFNGTRSRYKLGTKTVEFEKNVIAACGNSSSTAFLGYHTVCGVLDEVNYFKDKAGGESSAEDVATSLRGSMHTRAPKDYKLLMISSVRAVGDYLTETVESIRQRGYEIPWDEIGQRSRTFAF